MINVVPIIYAPSIDFLSIDSEDEYELVTADRAGWRFCTNLMDIFGIVRQSTSLDMHPRRFVIYPRFLTPEVLREFHAAVTVLADEHRQHAFTIVEDSGLFVRATTPYARRPRKTQPELAEVPYGGYWTGTHGHQNFYAVCGLNSPPVFHSIDAVTSALWPYPPSNHQNLGFALEFGGSILARTTASSYKNKHWPSGRKIQLKALPEHPAALHARQATAVFRNVQPKLTLDSAPLRDVFNRLMDMARSPEEFVFFKKAMTIDPLSPSCAGSDWPLELLEYRASYAHGYTPVNSTLFPEVDADRVFVDLYDKVMEYDELRAGVTSSARTYAETRAAATEGFAQFVSLFMRFRAAVGVSPLAVDDPPKNQPPNIETYTISTLDLARSESYGTQMGEHGRLPAWAREHLFVLEPNDAMLAGWHPDTTLYAQILHDAKMQPLPEHLCQ